MTEAEKKIKQMLDGTLTDNELEIFAPNVLELRRNIIVSFTVPMNSPFPMNLIMHKLQGLFHEGVSSNSYWHPAITNPYKYISFYIKK